MTKEIISTEQAPKAIGPYSQAVKKNNILFVSGQIPLDPNTNKVVGKTIEDQTTQCFSNIKAILAKAGYYLEDIVCCNVFLQDMNEFARMNEIYSNIFEPISKKFGFPTRATIEVSALPKGVKIEIQVTAIK